jgi:hypothetical protein
MVENGDSARMFGNHLQQWIRLIGQIAINVCDDANAGKSFFGLRYRNIISALCMNIISEMFARQCSLDNVQLGVIGAELCELARILSQRRRSDQFVSLLKESKYANFIIQILSSIKNDCFTRSDTTIDTRLESRR